jgi:putative FmdB family regulatory protein
MYEYACQSCGQQFEKLVRSMNSTDPVACPKCASTQTQRTLSVFAVSGEGGASKSTPLPTGGCGRCGGPGPCGMN